MPLGVTSIIPVFLFPLFGIMTSKEVSREYYQVSILLDKIKSKNQALVQTIDLFLDDETLLTTDFFFII